MRGLENYNIARFEADNTFGFPHVFPCDISVDISSVNWIDFDTALSKRDTLSCNGLHFFIDDYLLMIISFKGSGIILGNT